MIEISAISSGTSARNEANTKASTSSAPGPPITDSRQQPQPALLRAAGRQRVEPADVHRRSGDRDAPQRGAGGGDRLRIGAKAAEPRGWRIGQQERGAGIG